MTDCHSAAPRAARARSALAAGALAMVFGAATARAQAVSVEVRDAASGRAVPQALVSLRADGAPGAAAQGTTSASGRRTLGVAPGRYRVDVRRIGNRPFTGPVVTVVGTDTAAVVVRLPRLPVALAALQVRGRAVCRTAADPAVVALWEAARTALTTTADGSAAIAAAAPAVVYERTLDTATAVVAETRTALPPDSTGARVFWALRPDVAERVGFVVGSLDEGAQFNGPDERMLVSDEFARTHCFTPARGGGPERRWLGVRFTPAPGRRVAEVAGVVWLDSTTAEPRRVEFDYVWSALPRTARGLGGEIEFGRLPTGEMAVRAWRLRAPIMQRGMTGVRLVGYREAGGTIDPPPVARVRVAGVVYDSLVGAPLAGALVSGAGAPGVALTDSAGRFTLDSAQARFGELVFSHPGLDSRGSPTSSPPSTCRARRPARSSSPRRRGRRSGRASARSRRRRAPRWGSSPGASRRRDRRAAGRRRGDGRLDRGRHGARPVGRGDAHVRRARRLVGGVPGVRRPAGRRPGRARRRQGGERARRRGARIAGPRHHRPARRPPRPRGRPGPPGGRDRRRAGAERNAARRRARHRGRARGRRDPHGRRRLVPPRGRAGGHADVRRAHGGLPAAGGHGAAPRRGGPSPSRSPCGASRSSPGSACRRTPRGRACSATSPRAAASASARSSTARCCVGASTSAAPSAACPTS
jgi:hypothetical protein